MMRICQSLALALVLFATQSFAQAPAAKKKAAPRATAKPTPTPSPTPTPVVENAPVASPPYVASGKSSKFSGFASLWTMQPTDIMEIKKLRVEAGIGQTTGEIKVKVGDVSGKAKLASNGILVAVASPVGDAVTLALPIYKSWDKISSEGSGSDDTQKTLFTIPQAAFALSSAAGLGLAYEYFLEEDKSNGTAKNSDLAYGRAHLSGSFKAGNMTFGLGLKNATEAKKKIESSSTTGTTTSTTTTYDYKYLANEVTAKMATVLSDAMTFGVSLQIFDYDRKGDINNTFSDSKLEIADRFNLALMLDNRFTPMVSLQTLVFHSGAAGYNADLYTSNGIELNPKLHPNEACTIGLQIHYATGGYTFKSDEEDDSIKVEGSNTSLALWTGYEF